MLRTVTTGRQDRPTSAGSVDGPVGRHVRVVCRCCCVDLVSTLRTCSGQRHGVVLRESDSARPLRGWSSCECEVGSPATELASLRTTSVPLPAREPSSFWRTSEMQ
jgi:hypothetical protein